MVQRRKPGGLRLLQQPENVFTNCSFSPLVQTFQSDKQNRKLTKMFMQSCRSHAVKSPRSKTSDEKALCDSLGITALDIITSGYDSVMRSEFEEEIFIK